MAKIKEGRYFINGWEILASNKLGDWTLKEYGRRPIEGGYEYGTWFREIGTKQFLRFLAFDEEGDALADYLFEMERGLD